MPNIQIKDVPAEAHAVLTRRAAEKHQSLQAFLREHLIEIAAQPTLAELFDEIDQGPVGGPLSLDEAVQLIREERESH